MLVKLVVPVLGHVLRVVLVGGILIYIFPDAPSIILGAVGKGVGELMSSMFDGMFGELKAEIIKEVKELMPSWLSQK